MQTQKLVTVKEVADYLSVKPSTIYGWAELRKIPSYKINGSLRFRMDEVKEHIEGCKNKI
jgi:excisionase family DNA binding protein